MDKKSIKIAKKFAEKIKNLLFNKKIHKVYICRPTKMIYGTNNPNIKRRI